MTDVVGETRTGVASGASARPAAPLRGYVHRYEGYELRGLEPGSHIGMPGTELTVVIPFGAPLTVSRTAVPDQQPGWFGPLATGLGMAPVVIEHDGNQFGIQLSLTPAGCRALFGAPTSALGQWMIPLEDLLDVPGRGVADVLAAAPSWADRFAYLDRLLVARLSTTTMRAADDVVSDAWSLLTGSSQVRVADVASTLGLSRRHLATRFRAEFGVTPKDAARLARFSRSHRLLRRVHPPSLAEVSAWCGYFDQAHMARDWRELAGSAPSVWRSDEQFAFVQDPHPAGIG